MMMFSPQGILRRWRTDERGAALVEMALITPLMITLSVGVFEFSNIFYAKLLVEAGLRDGARYIARCYRDLAPEPCQTIGLNLAATGSIDGSGERVRNWAVADIDVDYIETNVTLTEEGTQTFRSNSGTVIVVGLSTEFQYSGLGLFGAIGLSSPTIRSTHQERVLGW